MRHIILILVIIAAPLSVAVKAPVAPGAPTVKGSSNSRPLYNPSGSNKPNSGLFHVIVHLADGRTARGRVLLPQTVFRIRQTVNGFRYLKTIPLSELRSLSILSWQPLSRGAAGSGRTLFYFLPSTFELITEGGRTLIKQRLKQFDALLLSSRYGSTKVYGYFADYWVGTGRNGRWLNSGSRNFCYNARHPDPACLVRIVFLNRGHGSKSAARGR